MFSPFGGLPAEEVDAALSEYAKTLPKDERKGFKERFWETNIGGLLQSIAGAVTLPGDVYAGKVDPMSDEAIGRSFELAGLLNVGSGAVPAKPNELRAGIKAYHGSPHDFDRFDLSKIGTGEGAQAYGHGLYFAGNEDVAKSYRDTLRGFAPIPKEFDDLPQNVRRAILEQAGSDDPPKVAARLAGNASSAVRNMDQAAVEKMIVDYRDAARGRMYEVELQTSPERLLDWDKPLSQQPANVRDAVNRVAREPAPYGLDRVSDDMRLVEMKRLIQSPEGIEALSKQGVDGIKYLDGGSRGAGQGSSNYVMFDDKLIKVLRKYGVATLAALPAAGLFELGLTPEDVQQVN